MGCSGGCPPSPRLRRGWLGANPALHPTGAVFSVILYAPIVLYRLVTVGRFWPVSSLTLGIAGLEVALLLGAVWVLKRG